MSAGIDVEALERFDALRGYMLASPLPMEAHAPRPELLRMSGRSYSLGGLPLHTVDATGLTGVRTAAMARSRTEPRLVVSLVHRGAAEVLTADRVVRLGAGGLVAIPSTVAQESRYRCRTFKSSVMLPMDGFRLPAAAPIALSGGLLDAAGPAARVLRSFLLGLVEAVEDLGEAELAGYRRPLTDLVHLALAEHAGTAAPGPDARTLGLRLLDDARRRAADPDLDAAALARAHHVSERTVYAALAREGVHLREHLLRERLRLARRLLRDEPDAAVGAVAMRCGFPDHSSFSRAFRAATGTTPRAWRRGDGPEG